MSAIILSASVLWAQSADHEAVLIAAIEQAGCVVSEANEQAILTKAGLSEQEGSAIVMQLMSQGRAVPQDDDLRLVTGKCN